MSSSFEDNISLAKLSSSFEDNLPLATIAKSSTPSVVSTHNSVVDTTPIQKSPCSLVSSSPLNSQISTKSNTSSTPSQLTISPVATKDGADNIEVKTPKLESPLPEGLSKELTEDIKKLKDFATAYVKGKGFFTTEVNKVLLR